MTAAIVTKPPKGWHRVLVGRRNQQAVIDALKGKKLLIEEIAAITGFTGPNVGMYLRRLLDAKPKQVYIVGYHPSSKCGRRKFIYALGSRPDAIELMSKSKTTAEEDEPPPPPIEQQEWCSALFAPPIAF